MSVIIRLQNLPWSANALDIRNFFRGLSIPEGGVHIVGGELGDAFIAFSTDEDARQAMMLDGGKIKEIQVRLLLSSRSEMHKVIEAARQTVPILTLTAPAPAPAVIPPPLAAPVVIAPPISVIPTPPPVTPFSAALGSNSLASFGIPGIGNPQEIPQPAVIEPPAPLVSPPIITTPADDSEKDDDKSESKRSYKRRSRTRSRSRDRDRKDRKRDRRDRSRSRDRRRRDRSRSRDRRDRKRDRKNRSRSRDRSREHSPQRRSRDRRNFERKSPPFAQEKPFDVQAEGPPAPPPPAFNSAILPNSAPPLPQVMPVPANIVMPNNPMGPTIRPPNRFNDPSMAETFNKLQELGKKRNPNAFQGDQQNGGGRFAMSRGGGKIGRGGGGFGREGRSSRFEDPPRDCCVAIRNAPNHTSYGDVRRFFPFMIDKHGIKMINDNMGRRTGNIFVRFCDPRSKHLSMQRKNNELKGAQVIVEALDDEDYEAAVDSFLPYRDDNGDEDPTLVISDHEEKSQPAFSVLKLSDLPNFVKEHDIIKAFSDFSLLSIMLNDCRMTRTKIAYVQFVKTEDAKIAFDQKDKYLFGRRPATVVPVSDEDYDKEKAVQNEKIPEPRVVQKAPREIQNDIQEIPSSPHEIQNIPREIQNDPREIHNHIMRGFQKETREITSDLRHNQNDPRIEMEPPQERESVAPRDPRQRRQFEGKGAPTVPLAPPQSQGASFFGAPFVPGQQFAAPFPTPQFGGFPSGNMDPRTAAANWANRPSFPDQLTGIVPKSMSTEIEDEPLDCVLMKGLPQDATDRTIVTFLSDTGAVPARIHLMLDTNGMPSGDCFCEFRSPQEARLAATKHGQNLEGCRVTVDLVTRGVVDEALEGPKQPDLREGLLGTGPPQQFFEPRGGYVPRGSFRGRGGYDRGFDLRGDYESGRGGYRGRGGYERGGRGGYERGGRGGYERGGRGGYDRGGRGGYERGGRGIERGRGRGFGRGRGGYMENGRDREAVREEDTDPALENFGAPGCVVTMENVPFLATVEEIMSYFADFELTQDDIIRRFNERGYPTGDARVAFRTPFDAQRAVKTRHMDTIHDRRIALSIL